MKAVVCERYGPPEVLRLVDIPKPVPGPHDVLIKVHATTVTSGDWRVRSLTMPPGFALFARPALGLRRPRQPILGTELAGEIEAVGAAVTRFKIGERVVAFPGARMGAHAEYRVMPETGAIARKPDNLSFEEAAALCFGGTTALHFLRKGKVGSGDKVLINGASGAVGTAAVQLARYFGAEVTAVCSAGNFELVRSLGAHHVIDYTREDFTDGRRKYDIIMDTAGTAPFRRARRALVDGGRLLGVLGPLSDLVRSPFVPLTTRYKLIAGPAPERAEDVALLVGLAAAGTLKPVIDRRYPLEQIAEAHRHVDAGHKRGSVVVTVVGSRAPVTS